MRKFTHAIALLAAGAAAYYAAPVALRLLRPTRAPAPAPIAVVQPLSGSIDDAGDAVLINSLVALERHATVEAEMVQSGYLLDQPLEIAGVYRQKGRAADRRFAAMLQGRLANTPLRLWQVSNGVHLYTDLAWGENPPITQNNATNRRDVTQIDLRKVRQQVAPRPQNEWSDVGRGEASASTLDPSVSAAFGGLPMLLESLGANFHFGAPRKMTMHNLPVFVLIGHWRPASFEALAPTNPNTGVPDPAASGRLPNHVLLALGASDLFPYLVEYRSPQDALSAPELTDDSRLQQSGRPMLRLEFRRPRFGVPIADAQFQYPEAGSIDRRDITDGRLENLRKRRKLKIAARSDRQPLGR